MYVSEPVSTPPPEFLTPLQETVYKTLILLEIPFLRVSCEDGSTMESCKEIDSALDAETVKTLFLCNRQKTSFYLFITEGDKPFVTKNFSSALGVSRVSFAPEDKLNELMGVKTGATTVFSCLLEESESVRLVFDETVLSKKLFCCTDGTNTGFVRISTDDLIKKLLPKMGRNPEIINI